MTDFIQVFTTVDDEAKARELARALVGSRLVACAQVLGPLQGNGVLLGPSHEQGIELSVWMRRMGKGTRALRAAKACRVAKALVPSMVREATQQVATSAHTRVTT